MLVVVYVPKEGQIEATVVAIAQQEGFGDPGAARKYTCQINGFKHLCK
jgi:hypothetical protein